MVNGEENGRNGLLLIIYIFILSIDFIGF